MTAGLDVLSTGDFLLAIPRSRQVYKRQKSGYYSADILQYSRFNVRGKGEPEKTIKFEDGILYAPGSRGMPTPVLEVKKGLEEDFKKELADIVSSFEKANFKTQGVSTKTENPEEIAKAVMQRENVVLTLKCRKWSERFEWPSPSSFSAYSLFFDHPKRYIGNKVALEYEIGSVGEVSEEERILIKGIDVKMAQEHGFR